MNLVKGEAGIFHVHVDGKKIPTYVRRGLEDMGFVDTSFTNPPTWYAGNRYPYFAPPIMLTKMPDSKQEFDRICSELQTRCQGMTGYFEGEFVKSFERIDESPYDDSVHLPFRIERRKLRGPPREPFRETEFHLIMDADRSDPRLIRKLLDAGLYAAFFPIDGRTEIVFTMQGYVRDIDPLTGRLRQFLEEAGGAAHCGLMEERALRYGLFNATHEGLPEIADKVVYL